jgi:transcriptional regulator with XRE-family HTH domain
MDNNKTGKLIASQRKKKGLTQQELGDKVGVGFRAVSKWERGLTSPDITIVNELSKILGISSDELLTGKISKDHKEPKKKMSLKIKITLSIIITLLVILTSTLAYYNDKTYTYELVSNNEKYKVLGNITFNKRDISIIINEFTFSNKELYNTKLKNYEYQIITNDETIIAYGYLTSSNIIEEKTIGEFIEKFRINYSGKINSTRKEILKNNLIIKLNFLTEDEQEIHKEIKIKLTNTKKGQ